MVYEDELRGVGSQVWRYIPVSVALERLTQEDVKLQASLGCHRKGEKREEMEREEKGGWMDGGVKGGREKRREEGLGTERRLNIFSA